MILIVCALPSELRFFEPPPGVKVLAGGVGPVEAAIATSDALARGGVSIVIDAGIAGIYRDAGRVGDARLIVHETLADFGLEGGLPLALPEGTVVETTAADERLVARLEGLVARAHGLTVSTVTTTAATGERRRARYGHETETMEGFAVLRAAARSGVPAIGVRGISNYIGDRATSEWDFAAGARATADALRVVLAALGGVAA